MNIWEKMRRKKGLTRVEIAKEMGISEEKVKEVEKNMRTMPKNEIDKYIKSIHNMSNGERELKIAEAKAWYEKADFKTLMKEFGYKTQAELAEVLHCDKSSISTWFAKSTGNHKIGTSSLLKLYYFFNDGFNKKISSETIETPEKHTKDIKDYSVDRETALNWWKGFDLKQAIINMPVKNQKDFCRKYNLRQSGVSEWSNRKATPQTNNLMKLYEIFNGREEVKVEEPISIPEFMPKENVTVFKGTEPISISVLSPEEMGQEATIFKPSDFDNLVYNDYEEPTSELKEDTTKDLILENRELKQRIARYEALIDIIISKNKEN